MRTAFGILLFVLVYAPIAYVIYDEVTGRRSRIRSPLSHRPRLQRQQPHLASRYQ